MTRVKMSTAGSSAPMPVNGRSNDSYEKGLLRIVQMSTKTSGRSGVELQGTGTYKAVKAYKVSIL